MELRTIRRADVPEYLRSSAFFLALDGEDDEEFSIAAPYFKVDTAIADEGSSRNLLHTLRFWGVDTIPASVCDAAFDQDCHFFVSVAFEFVKELKYLTELIQLRLVPPEFRLEYACKIGNLQILRWLTRNGSNGSNGISRICLEAAAREGHVHVIRFLHSFRGRRHWCRISDVAASKGHLSCVEYVFKRTKTFFNAAYDAAAHGHAHILRFIAQHDGKLETVLFEAGLRHLEVVQCLYILQVPHWPHAYADNLAAANSLGVLRFVLARGCPIHDYTLCRARSAECVQILVQCGGYQLNDQSTLRAAQAGLEVLKYVHAQGCPLTIHTACRAAQYNKLDVLKYLHEQDCSCDGTCLQMAEQWNSYECLVYMYEQGCAVPLWYRNYLLNPQNHNLSTWRWNSKCMSYLRIQFDFEQKRFKDRDASGFALIEDPEEITPLPADDVRFTAQAESVTNTCSCVIQ